MISYALPLAFRCRTRVVCLKSETAFDARVKRYLRGLLLRLCALVFGAIVARIYQREGPFLIAPLMDTVYPQPIRLCLDTSARRKRGSQNRYRTQPITFSEIKEVDEENADEEEPDVNRRMSAELPHVLASKSSTNINAKYDEFLTRKRPEKRITRKLQNRLDFSKKPSVSSIPGSPENGINTENPINLLPKIPSRGVAPEPH